MKPFLADFYNKGIENLTLVAELAKWSASLKERWALAALQKDVAQPEARIWGCVRKQQAQQRYNNMFFGRATAPAPEAIVARPQTAQPWVAGTTAPQVLAPAPPPAPVRLSTAPPSLAAALAPHTVPTAILVSQPEPGNASPGGGGAAPPAGPPAWIIELLELIATNKRQFLRKLMAHLAEATRRKLHILSFDTQMYLVWASLHLPSTWISDLEKTLRQLLRAYALATPAARAIAGAPGSPDGATLVIKFKPVYHCGGIGTGAVSFHIGLINVQKKDSQVKVEMLGAYSRETNPVSKELESLALKKLGVALSQLGDASGWPRLVEQNIRDWQKIDFVLAPITTAPCANLSIANAPMNALKDEGVGGLHTAPTSITHACYEGDFLAASVSLWFHKDCDRYLQNLDRFILLAALCSIRRRAHEI